MSRATQHLQLIKVEDDYETPTPLYKLGKKISKINPVIDVCATKKHHKTPRYFTKDALKKQWNKPFWMNPPYSEAYKFMKYAYEQHKKHNVDGLCLVYAKTDVKWFHRFVQGKARTWFIEGRVKFWINGKVPKWCDECKKQFKSKEKYCRICRNKLKENPSPYPSMFVIYKARKRKKKKRSKRIGLID